jgi:aldose 1-epimerase
MAQRKEFCFSHPSGKDIYLFTLRNLNGTEALVTNYGAILMSYKILMPDKSVNDIVLGFDNVHDYLRTDYLQQYPFFGAAIGRYSNRIKNARFKIDEEEFTVSKNWGRDQLHGGFDGFDKKVWNFVSFDEECNILQLKYLSPDGEEGFPGNLDIKITFELNDDNDLIYSYTATTDKTTILNPTHHSYFNLNNGDGTIHDHEVKINAEKFLEQDENLTVTGNFIDVANTRWDFREFHSVRERLEDGYDQSFVLENAAGQFSEAAELSCKSSGLKLQVFTTDPIVHLYTGQGIPKLSGKNSVEYGPYSGLCLETQKHPNAINIPGFPNTILKPGEIFNQKTAYKICLPPK